MRAVLLVALLVAGCKSEHPGGAAAPSPSAPAAAAPTATAPAAPPAAPPPASQTPPAVPSAPSAADFARFVAATSLVDAYRKNPIAADRDYKGRVLDVLGIVASIEQEGAGGAVVRLRAGKSEQRRALGSAGRHTRMLAEMADGLNGYGKQADTLRAMSRELQARGDDDDDRLIPCSFPAATVAAVADVEPGQLVDVRGTVLGLVGAMEVPSVGAASITWAGDKPSAPPLADAEAQRRALVAARSAEACLGRALAAEMKPGEASADDMKAMVDVAEAELQRLGERLPCPHPLEILTLWCGHAKTDAAREGRKYEPKSLCTDQVQRAVAVLQRGKPKEAKGARSGGRAR
jgi:hypothetical protein